jgi:hypothetical protein
MSHVVPYTDNPECVPRRQKSIEYQRVSYLLVRLTQFTTRSLEIKILCGSKLGICRSGKKHLLRVGCRNMWELP